VRSRPIQRVTSTFSTLSAPAAEEQFLEKNPWANPQHPAHRIGINRQGSNRSPFPETFLTPARQQRAPENGLGIGSASTIPEHTSAPVSSTFNTPHDGQAQQMNIEASNLNGIASHSASPFETRKTIPTSEPGPQKSQAASPENGLANSSPLILGADPSSPPQPSLGIAENIPERATESSSYSVRPPAITAGSGFGGGGRFGLI